MRVITTKRAALRCAAIQYQHLSDIHIQHLEDEKEFLDACLQDAISESNLNLVDDISERIKKIEGNIVEYYKMHPNEESPVHHNRVMQ